MDALLTHSVRVHTRFQICGSVVTFIPRLSKTLASQAGRIWVDKFIRTGLAASLGTFLLGGILFAPTEVV